MNLCVLFDTKIILVWGQYWYYLNDRSEDKGVHSFSQSIRDRNRVTEILTRYRSLASTLQGLSPVFNDFRIFILYLFQWSTSKSKLNMPVILTLYINTKNFFISSLISSPYTKVHRFMRLLFWISWTVEYVLMVIDHRSTLAGIVEFYSYTNHFINSNW